MSLPFVGRDNRVFIIWATVLAPNQYSHHVKLLIHSKFECCLTQSDRIEEETCFSKEDACFSIFEEKEEQRHNLFEDKDRSQVRVRQKTKPFPFYLNILDI